MEQQQTREEMIAILEQAGIEDAARLVSIWTYKRQVNNVSELMRLWIDKADETMQQLVVPYKFAAIGIDVYDTIAILDRVYKLSCIGVFPCPPRDRKKHD